MASEREKRIRRRSRAAIGKLERELAELRDLAPVARLAIRYVDAIDYPNPSEPFAIAKRRDELRWGVRSMRARLANAARRAA